MRKLAGPLIYAFVVAVGIGLMIPLAVHGSLGAAAALPWLAIATICLALSLGEAIPVMIYSRGRPPAALTISIPFVVALVAVAPLWLVLLARLVPSTINDFSHRVSFRYLPYNIAQNTLGICAARLAYSLIADQSYFSPTQFSSGSVIALFAAALVHFITENTTFYIFAVTREEVSLLRLLREELPTDLTLLPIELAISPLVLISVMFEPLILVLLFVPLMAVRRSTQLSGLRQREALHDTLTGLPNRAQLSLIIDEEIPQLSSKGKALALLAIDLDHFREINNILGMAVGDQLVKEVGQRLGTVLRENDCVARISGDEFAVIAMVGAATPQTDAGALAERLLRALSEPFWINKVRIDVQASIGIALAPDHAQTSEVLQSKADAALYEAKDVRNTWCYYEPGTAEDRSPEYLSLVGELRQGIDNGELELHYQPKIDVLTDVVCGVEALVRWRHPMRGLLGPQHFIPLAENTGLMRPLTDAVLAMALQQTRLWLDMGWEIHTSVNLSARHVAEPELPDEISACLSRYRVPPYLLTVEVTESSVMADSARASDVLRKVRELGVHISVDDFGTGYSSLSHLRQLEVDEIKIDRSFVMNLPGSDHDDVLVKAVIDLGHNLGLRVVAEGVEDAETCARLRQLHCDEIQGYFLSKPLPAQEITNWLQARQRPEVEHVSFLEHDRSW